MRVVKCMVCGTPNLALRSTRRTCSDKCRQSLRRKANAEEEAIRKAWEKRREAIAEEQPAANIVCRECGVYRYGGERCEVCNSTAAITLKDAGV